MHTRSNRLLHVETLICYHAYVTLSNLRSRKLYGLNVMYHNHSSLGVLQLSWCATASNSQ